MEHSPLGIETVGNMIAVLGDGKPVPLVRVGQADQALIKNVLDLGSRGIVVPLVSERADAEKVVRFCSYPPRGVRGVGFGRVSKYGLDAPRYFRSANDENLIVVQIETATALNNIEDILDVKEIDVAFLGPADLAMQLGLIDERSNPKVIDAMESVLKACKRHDKVAGVMAGSTEEVKAAIKRGFGFVSLGSDMRYLLLGATTFQTAARARGES